MDLTRGEERPAGRGAPGSGPMALPRNPLVHEINAWVWLRELADRLGRVVTLADVPDEVWDDVAGAGVDAVWLMGVWRRSPAGAAIARYHPGLAAAQRAALGDLTDADVVGSASCVRDYVVDEHLGGDAGLRVARAALAARGTALVLDFVANHVAPDHPWASAHPEWFVRGTPADLAAEPEGFLAIGDAVLARGRPPDGPPWPDVLQLDTRRSDVRTAAAEVVASIAERCDGVRCTTATMVLDDVFARTWGHRTCAGAPDGGAGYWSAVIAAARARHPGFVFWGEADRDLGPSLAAHGFDACDDARLHDLLIGRDGARAVTDHVLADPVHEVRTVRFSEHHDGPRLAARLAPPAGRAAALVAMTLPGVALLHDGQQVGRRVQLPVTLGRRPHEDPDVELAAWYGALGSAMAGGMRRGRWSPAPVVGWADNRSGDHLVAWTWTDPDGGHLVAVNLSADEEADGRIRLEGVRVAPVVLTDLLSGERYLRDGATVGTDGLYVALPPKGVHLLRW